MNQHGRPSVAEGYGLPAPGVPQRSEVPGSDWRKGKGSSATTRRWTVGGTQGVPGRNAQSARKRRVPVPEVALSRKVDSTSCLWRVVATGRCLRLRGSVLAVAFLSVRPVDPEYLSGVNCAADRFASSPAFPGDGHHQFIPDPSSQKRPSAVRRWATVRRERVGRSCPGVLSPEGDAPRSATAFEVSRTLARHQVGLSAPPPSQQPQQPVHECRRPGRPSIFRASPGRLPPRRVSLASKDAGENVCLA